MDRRGTGDRGRGYGHGRGLAGRCMGVAVLLALLIVPSVALPTGVGATGWESAGTLPGDYSSAPLAVLLGFGMGISIDIFYSSPGVHAGASVFTAWFRTVLLQMMEPRSGFAGNQIPSAHHFGMTWFLQFSAVVMAAHLLIYFSLDAFSFVFIGSILGKTVVAFALSMLFLLIYQQLFNPKN